MKKNITLRGVALAAFLSVSFMSQAQEQPRKFGKIPLTLNQNGVVRCATTENEQLLNERYPERNREQFEAWMAQKIQEGKLERDTKSGNAVYMIPVVVHVIHDGDAIGSNENISLARIQSQIRVLNEDFGSLPGTPGEDFSELGGDTGIRFCLAKIDIHGSAFDGVDRQNLGQASYNSNAEVENLKAATSWDPSSYFNIWTVNWGGELSNLLGYAQFPTASGLPGLNGGVVSPDTDGIAISWKNFGYTHPSSSAPYNRGRTASHEAGHYFGLRHIWGDTGGCNSTDYCADTPVAAEENRGCDPSTDSCPIQLGVDMIQNYMDYTDDYCMSLFTKDQADRMHTVLANSPNRSTLPTSTVCGTASSQEFQYLLDTNVYPNPAQDVLNISVASENMPDSYTIYNSVGQTITTVNTVTNASLTVNTSAYSNGIYFIKINKGAESKTIKFVKN